MTQSRHSAQLAFDFSASRADAIDLGTRIVRAGLAPNAVILEINRAIACPDRKAYGQPWSLPSRLYAFPVDYLPDHQGRGRLRLRHPRLHDHPGLAELRTLVPEPESWLEPLDDGIGVWHHAVDLMTPQHWPDLQRTLAFTTSYDVSTALAYALLHAPRKARATWTVAAARTAMEALDAEPDIDASRAFLIGPGIMPSHVQGRWVPNLMCRGPQAAWLVIHGLEAGWFAYDRSGALDFTPDGIARRAG
jgi:hypothetical protein